MKFLWSKRKFLLFVIISIIVITLGSIPLKIVIARYQAPYPQAILTLGGDPDREKYTAQLSLYNPSLPIWISTGSTDKVIAQTFRDAGIPRSRYYSDRRATDTVTNFTTLVKDFQKRKIQHIYLITSDFHIARAKAIATLVLGSQGITFTPISLATNRSPEPKIKTFRDIGRSLLWIFTRRTGSSLNQ